VQIYFPASVLHGAYVASPESMRMLRAKKLDALIEFICGALQQHSLTTDCIRGYSY
jgi:hypothetical protein